MRFPHLTRCSHKQLIMSLVGLGYVVLMLGNGAVSLTHPDEVFYIQTAKEMLSRDEWLTPYIFGQPQFEKPILSFWLFMAAIKIFGLGPFAGRFAPALFGMLGVIAAYGISWAMFKNKRLSFLSGMILMTSVMHLTLSRAVLTDMIFSVWVTLSVGAFYWAYVTPKFKARGIVLSFVLAGFAVMTKGLLGICFPAGIVLLFLLFRKDLRFLRTGSVAGGLVLFLVISLPWHIQMYHLHGQAFLYEYFQNVHVRRLFHAEHERLNTWYFYPLVIAGGMFPWTVFLYSAGKLFFDQLKEKGRASQPFLFLLAWVMGVFAFLQPAHSKLASYIFPVFPAVVIIIAYYLESLLSKEGKDLDRGFRRAGYALSAFLLAAGAGLVIMSDKYRSFIPDHRPVWFSMALFLIVALLVFWRLQKKDMKGALAAIPLTIAAILATVAVAKVYAEPWVSCQQISEMLQKVDHSRTMVLVSKFFVRGVKYYTDREVAVIDIRGRPFFSPHPIPLLDDDTRVDQFLRTQPVTYCIVRHANVADLEHIAGNGKFKLTKLGESGGKFLLKIER